MSYLLIKPGYKRRKAYSDHINSIDFCAICQNYVKICEKKKSLKCCHTFHSSCFIKWYFFNNSCPMCRKQL